MQLIVFSISNWNSHSPYTIIIYECYTLLYCYDVIRRRHFARNPQRPQLLLFIHIHALFDHIMILFTPFVRRNILKFQNVVQSVIYNTAVVVATNHIDKICTILQSVLRGLGLLLYYLPAATTTWENLHFHRDDFSLTIQSKNLFRPFCTCYY